MTVLMRALNLSNNFITWTSTSPDYDGTYAPESIQNDSAVIVSDTGGVTIENIGKLGLEYDPVGLWLFDDNLNDSSGNGFTLTGTPGYTTIERDKQIGAIFGTSAWTRPSRDASLAITGALTIEAVIRINFNGSGMGICALGGNGSSEALNVAYFPIIGGGGEMSLYWESGAGIARQVTSTVGVNLMPYGVPSHLVYTRSSDALAVVNFYVNGVNKFTGSATACTGSTDSTCRLRVGSDNVGASLIDRGTVFTSLKIIAAELTPAQVVDEYNRVLGGKTIAYPTI